MSKPHEKLLKPHEAAQYLQVSTSYLAKARMRGTGPSFIQIGRAIRYGEKALDDFKAQCTRVSTSQY